MEQLHAYLATLRQSLRNLLPIIAVVALFQVTLVRSWPDGWLPVLFGLLLAAAGIAFFLRGLEGAIFPLGRSLANEFAQRGSLPLLLLFGFSIGFAAVIAEPALIAVAAKTAAVSDGTIHATTLRLLVAFSVGLAVVVGLWRAIRRQPIHYYLLSGYGLLLVITWLTPPEITGLAFDIGAVSANLVTVPLLVALGIGLTGSLKGRGALADGFGLAALVVLAPRIAVQLYGVMVFSGDPETLAAVTQVYQEPLQEASRGVLAGLFSDLIGILAALLPILGVILVFQYLILRRRLPHPQRIAGGFLLLVIGLFLFTEGLFVGLFPIGEHMARELGGIERTLWVLLFVFLLGFAATLVEPALIATAERAAVLDPARLHSRVVRGVVAFGVGLGLTLGVARLLLGFPLEWLLGGVVALLLPLLLLAPRDLVAFCADLGGIATSDVTVPVITTLGVGLAIAFGGDALLDGFGLIALASLVPVLCMLLYAMAANRLIPGAHP